MVENGIFYASFQIWNLPFSSFILCIFWYRLKIWNQFYAISPSLEAIDWKLTKIAQNFLL